jgi:hypothetical protein
LLSESHGVAAFGQRSLKAAPETDETYKSGERFDAYKFTIGVWFAAGSAAPYEAFRPRPRARENLNGSATRDAPGRHPCLIRRQPRSIRRQPRLTRRKPWLGQALFMHSSERSKKYDRKGPNPRHPR